VHWLVFSSYVVSLALASNSISTISSWERKADMPMGKWENGGAELNGLIYSVGGADPYNYDWSAVFAYNITTDTWSTRASLTLPRRYHGTAVSGGYIYVCGGYFGQTVLNTALRYNPATNSWSQLASMTYARQGLTASAGSDGRIYCIGGNTGSNIVEVYDPRANQWSLGVSPPIPREGHAAVSSLDGNLIYIFGGYSSALNRYVASLEVYSVVSKTWKELAPMKQARLSPGAAMDSNGHIYALGGDGGAPCDGSVERYDPTTDMWSTIVSMLHPRSTFGAVRGFNGKIYVFGGQCSSPVINFTEALTIT